MSKKFHIHQTSQVIYKFINWHHIVIHPVNAIGVKTQFITKLHCFPVFEINIHFSKTIKEVISF